MRSGGSPFFSFYHIAGPPVAEFQPPSVFKDSVRLQEPTKGGPSAAKQTTATSISSDAAAGQFAAPDGPAPCQGETYGQFSRRH